MTWGFNQLRNDLVEVILQVEVQRKKQNEEDAKTLQHVAFVDLDVDLQCLGFGQ